MVSDEQQLSEAFCGAERFRHYIEHVEKVPAKEGLYSPLPSDLHSSIQDALKKRGISRLYSHQALCWQKARERRDFVVVTPTSSGKTLCYNLPVLDRIIRDPGSRALYLFPTKALSQDQMKELHDLTEGSGQDVKVYTFDGDTPSSARAAIRKQGHIVVSNPDMLHQGILPHHTKWMHFFQNLRYVVVDEMHAYRGVFGSHLANVLRRLKRIAAFYGADPMFIFCSATIANPGEHAERLLEKPVELVDENGAPSGAKTLIFYNPPVINKELGIRASYIKQARKIAGYFINEGRQAIVFALSRLNVEVMTKYLKDDFESSRESMGEAEKIAGYRGGYLPKRRREIEKGIKDGQIRGVISTNALELGIDIGSLDVAVIAGYPGSIASTWQQLGRAGRRGTESLGVVVGRSDPLDQFLMKHPEYFFSRSPEHARINPDNLLLLVDHVKCASFELPFSEGDSFGKIGPEQLTEILKFLQEGGILHKNGKRWYWAEDVYPAVAVNLRRGPEGNFVVVDTSRNNRILAEVDYSGAPMTIYPDAIYMADGDQYIVDELDWDGRKALVRPSDSDYYTDAIDYTNVKVLQEDDLRESGPLQIFMGEIQVVTRAVGFKKIKFYTMENVGYGNINLPDIEMATSAFWFTVPQTLLDRLPFSRADIIDGVLGISRAIHSIAILKIMGESHDLHRSVGDKSAEWFAMNTVTERGIYSAPDENNASVRLDPNSLESFQPTVFLYDNYPGGMGFSSTLYRSCEDLLVDSWQLVKNCSCQDGCPSCTGPGAESGTNSKTVALKILQECIAHTGIFDK